jgi:hypothetical protein
MAKKRKITSVKTNSSENQLFDFVLGVLLFFVIELIFMLGGLYLQNYFNVGGATGLPSLLGLILWSLLACTYKGKKELFLGGLTISILVPIILIIVTITSFVKFLPIMYYSIAAFIILELATITWLIKKK